MRKLKLIIAICMFFAIHLSAQNIRTSNYAFTKLLDTLLAHSVKEISVSEVKKLNKLNPNTVYLDAREKNEFEVSHIENAIYFGYSKPNTKVLKKILKTTPLIVYCSVGYRSEKISEMLMKLGYKNVRNLYGGIFEWKNEGFEVVNKLGKTENIHAFNKNWGVWLNKGVKIY